MPLIDLLTTNAFTLGVQTDSYGNSLPRIPGIPPNGGWDTYFNVKNANYNQVGHSKNLKLPSSFTDMGTEQGWNNNRISWANDGGLVDVMEDPTFVIGESHINDGIVDGTGGRGGQALQQDRRIIDKERIFITHDYYSINDNPQPYLDNFHKCYFIYCRRKSFI